MYDLMVLGGGLSGVSTAIAAAKHGLRTIIVEKMSFLGGSATGALVSPMMKNMLSDNTQLASDFCIELMQEMQKSGDALTFKDNNIGWFNPEILKCTLDSFCQKYNVDVLFNTIPIGVTKSNDRIQSCKLFSLGKEFELSAKYFVDATGNADFANICEVGFENGNNDQNQAMTLRFIMGNVDLKSFSEFLKEIDPSDETSPIYEINNEIHLSCAYTSDNDSWKLKPYFDKAIQNGDLAKEDCAYFQLFTIPNQKNAIGFNAPRIYSEKPLNALNPKDISCALIQGRKQILKLAEFCKKYLKGFENAYISQIAPMLGVRDSRRVKGIYTLNEEDILSAKKVEHPAAKSNYPIDVHSYQKNGNILKQIDKSDYYEIPIECMQIKEFDNLFITGRAISTTFLAQASIRIIPNCIALGENLGKFIAEKCN